MKIKNKTSPIELPGGVLKIKKGYNPNSSSIGTLVYSFPIAVAVFSGIITALSIFLSKEKNKEAKTSCKILNGKEEE